jgi:enoyl-CoA hydratase/carnithine racemase
MTESLILVDRQTHYTVIRINRPNHGNALSLEVIKQISKSITDIQRSEVTPIIFTGSGDRFFCAGGDIKSYAQIDSVEQLNDVFGAARDLPVIAAVNGLALGGGAELALACDFRYIEEHALIGFPQVRLGIIPGWDGIGRLARVVGLGVATKLLMTGESMTSSDAIKCNLVTSSTPKGQSLMTSVKLCESLSLISPAAVSALKHQLINTYGGCFNRAESRNTFANLWFSEHHRKAERDFINRSET